MLELRQEHGRIVEMMQRCEDWFCGVEMPEPAEEMRELIGLGLLTRDRRPALHNWTQIGALVLALADRCGLYKAKAD